MYFIIVGAGPEGSSLLELALKDGHQVSIIEKDEKRAQAVLQKYNVRVFHAGIAEGGILVAFAAGVFVVWRILCHLAFSRNSLNLHRHWTIALSSVPQSQ